MTIGTAKPSESELKKVKHHFINSHHVGQLYGAGHYEKDALELLSTLFAEHQTVVMVGGSGLYLDAVIHGVDDYTEVPVDMRNMLNSQYQEKGLAWLQETLKKHDPVYFEQVDTHNPQRMIRALEICLHTGQAFSSFAGKTKPARQFTTVGIFLNPDRTTLYAQINKRVDEMLEKGLVEEVKQLLPWRNFNALKTVGYKEVFDFLDGHCSLADAVALIKQHTRNYAKRQVTWFKNKTDFEQFVPNDTDKIKAYIDLILSHG